MNACAYALLNRVFDEASAPRPLVPVLVLAWMMQNLAFLLGSQSVQEAKKLVTEKGRQKRQRLESKREMNEEH